MSSHISISFSGKLTIPPGYLLTEIELASQHFSYHPEVFSCDISYRILIVTLICLWDIQVRLAVLHFWHIPSLSPDPQDMKEDDLPS